MRLLIVACTIACACKSESTTSSMATPGSGSSAAPVAPAANERGSLAGMIPTVPSAKVLSSKAPNEAYAVATWCIDEADAVARITAALERDGWTSVRSRGETPRISISAMKGEIRFSARLGGSDQRCAGTYATATVMRLGKLDEKLLENTEKLH